MVVQVTHTTSYIDLGASGMHFKKRYLYGEGIPEQLHFVMAWIGLDIMMDIHSTWICILAPKSTAIYSGSWEV